MDRDFGLYAFSSTLQDLRNGSSNFPTIAIARESLMDSVHHLENTSCVLFIPRTDEQDYVIFKLSTR